MTEWENNHKVTCSECLHSVIHNRWVDGLPFRYDITCRLRHETDYHIPYIEAWSCKDYEEWSIWRFLKRSVKEVISRRILND